MSDNPFKLIRSTDQPPETLRSEVVSSVRFGMFIMGIAKLFVVDLSKALFDKVRHTSSGVPPASPTSKPSSPHGL